MRAFLLTMFWLQIFAVITNMSYLCGADYPRARSSMKLGADLVGLMLAGGLAAWAGIVLWGAA